MSDRARLPGLAVRWTLLGQSIVLFAAASAGGAVLFSLWITGVSLIAVGIGIPLTLVLTSLVRWFADLHRDWASARLGDPIPRPYRAIPAGGWLVRLRAVLADPATWRDATWLITNAVTGSFLCSLSFGLLGSGVFYLIYPYLYWVTPPGVFDSPFGFFLRSVAESFTLVPLGLVCFVLWYVTAGPLMDLNARAIRFLLGPTEQAALRARVQQLASSRSEAIDAQATELRRIERDLHDGAQARLVSLGMSLGLAEQVLATDPEAAQRLLAEARESTSSALDELRDLARGIHPPVLADRGLDGALRALALANPLDTAMQIDIPGRLSAPVESAAYFCVAEVLTNAIKHAQPQHILVHLRFADGILSMRVLDDGRGGARLEAGTGLRGVQRRLAAFDGTLTVDSPAGGPTDVRMAMPCELSSPKTSPS